MTTEQDPTADIPEQFLRIIDAEISKWLRTVYNMPLDYIAAQLQGARDSYDVAEFYGDHPRMILNQKKIEYLTDEIDRRTAPEQEESNGESAGTNDNPGGEEPIVPEESGPVGDL